MNHRVTEENSLDLSKTFKIESIDNDIQNKYQTETIEVREDLEQLKIFPDTGEEKDEIEFFLDLNDIKDEEPDEEIKTLIDPEEFRELFDEKGENIDDLSDEDIKNLSEIFLKEDPTIFSEEEDYEGEPKIFRNLEDEDSSTAKLILEICGREKRSFCKSSSFLGFSHLKNLLLLNNRSFDVALALGKIPENLNNKIVDPETSFSLTKVIKLSKKPVYKIMAEKTNQKFWGLRGDFKKNIKNVEKEEKDFSKIVKKAENKPKEGRIPIKEMLEYNDLLGESWPFRERLLVGAKKSVNQGKKILFILSILSSINCFIWLYFLTKVLGKEKYDFAQAFCSDSTLYVNIHLKDFSETYFHEDFAQFLHFCCQQNKTYEVGAFAREYALRYPLSLSLDELRMFSTELCSSSFEKIIPDSFKTVQYDFSKRTCPFFIWATETKHSAVSEPDENEELSCEDTPPPFFVYLQLVTRRYKSEGGPLTKAHYYRKESDYKFSIYQTNYEPIIGKFKEDITFFLWSQKITQIFSRSNSFDFLAQLSLNVTKSTRTVFGASLGKLGNRLV